MITPDYIRTMAEYNAEMNRRLYGAATQLSVPIWGPSIGKVLLCT
jgi:uncharacterized damage-inducible protein DinB